MLLGLAALGIDAHLYAGKETLKRPWSRRFLPTSASLPPLMVQVGDDEILLDDSRRFAPLIVHDAAMAIVARSWALRLGVIAMLAVVVSACGSKAEEGEPFDSGPSAGATLAVVGIQYDATLPLRSSPGNDKPVKASLGPLAADLVATGRARLLTSSIWFEVTAGGVTGWADSASLAYLGATYDATARIVEKLGSPPTADSMLELGRIVASADVSNEPGLSERVTVTVAPTLVGDLGEVTYDVWGFHDDSVGGERLHVFGTSGNTFTLKKVEATYLCRRGGSADSLCL